MTTVANLVEGVLGLSAPPKIAYRIVVRYVVMVTYNLAGRSGAYKCLGHESVHKHHLGGACSTE